MRNQELSSADFGPPDADCADVILELADKSFMIVEVEQGLQYRE